MSAIIYDFNYHRMGLPLVRALRAHAKHQPVGDRLDVFLDFARVYRDLMGVEFTDCLMSLLLMRLPIEMSESQYLTAIQNGERACKAVEVFSYLRPDLLQPRHIAALLDCIAHHEPSYLSPEFSLMRLVKIAAENEHVVFDDAVQNRLEEIKANQPHLQDKVEDVFTNLERRHLAAHLRSMPSLRLMRGLPQQRLA